MARGEPFDTSSVLHRSPHKLVKLPQNAPFQECAHCNGLACFLKGLGPGGHLFVEHGAHP